MTISMQRFLCTRSAHAWTLRFLANDSASLVRWGATCRAARAATDETDPIWNYVWSRGLGKTKPLGPRQRLRPKAYVLKEMARRLKVDSRANDKFLNKACTGHTIGVLRAKNDKRAAQFAHIDILEGGNIRGATRTDLHRILALVSSARVAQMERQIASLMKQIERTRADVAHHSARAVRHARTNYDVNALMAESKRITKSKKK